MPRHAGTSRVETSHQKSPVIRTTASRADAADRRRRQAPAPDRATVVAAAPSRAEPESTLGDLVLSLSSFSFFTLEDSLSPPLLFLALHGPLLLSFEGRRREAGERPWCVRACVRAWGDVRAVESRAVFDGQALAMRGVVTLVERGGPCSSRFDHGPGHGQTDSNVDVKMADGDIYSHVSTMDSIRSMSTMGL